MNVFRHYVPDHVIQDAISYCIEVKTFNIQMLAKKLQQLGVPKSGVRPLMLRSVNINLSVEVARRIAAKLKSECMASYDGTWWQASGKTLTDSEKYKEAIIRIKAYCECLKLFETVKEMRRTQSNVKPIVSDGHLRNGLSVAYYYDMANALKAEIEMMKSYDKRPTLTQAAMLSSISGIKKAAKNYENSRS